MTEPVLTGIRWSDAVICPRRAVYQGLNIPAEPYSEETLGYFRRGRILGRVIAEELAERLVEQGRPAGKAEVEVPWPAANPIATGHADYYIPDETTIVENVSNADCHLPPHKAVQAAGYAINHPTATAALVRSVDPSSYREVGHPIDFEGLRPMVEAIQAEVVAGVKDGVIPDRFRPLRRDLETGELGFGDEVESPMSQPCRDCPFRRECWKSWEPYPVGKLPEKYDADLERLAELEDKLGRVKKGLKSETDERDALRDKLEGMMVEGGRYRGGDVEVRWTEVAPRRSFRLGDYETAGHELPEDAKPFVSEGGGYRRWTVKRVERS